MYKILCLLAFNALYMGLTHSWEIAISADHRLEFYINDTKTDTVRLVSQNPKALAYDEVNDILLYVDKQSGDDVICGYHMASVEFNCYTQRNGRDIQGLAFDPMTQTLFYTDTKEKSINWLSIHPGSRDNVNEHLLIKMDEGIPTDITVDSCRGYIYWITNNLTKSRIERALFDGSKREVVVNSIYDMDLHSLGICQQTKKIYWIMPKNSELHHLYRADLTGENVEFLFEYMFSNGERGCVTHPNLITISQKNVFVMGWCSNCESKKVWKLLKPSVIFTESYLNIPTQSKVSIVAKYDIKEQFEDIQECQSLMRLVSHNSVKIARKHEGPFCVHGVKVDGQSICKCSLGYIGERCDVSVCQNYCLQGICRFNNTGVPECSCKAGYIGERCEVNVCLGYCLNNATCNLDEESNPVCHCSDGHEGTRCEAVTKNAVTEEVPKNEGTRCEPVTKNAVTEEVPKNTEGTITVADLLAYWRKPVKTIVVVEVKSN